MSEAEIKGWARRRGFRLTLRQLGMAQADLVVDRPGPHFILVLAKSWFQRNETRCSEDGIYDIEQTGARAVLFPPAA